MAPHPIHAQIAAVEAAAKASPENGALAAAARTLREVAVAVGATGWRIEGCPCCGTNWHVEEWRPPNNRLIRAMEGLMP